MANDFFFTANETWAAIEDDVGPITDGVFNVNAVLNSSRIVYFHKFNGTPTDVNGAAFFNDKDKSFQYPLSATEQLYCRTVKGEVKFGVIPA